LAVPGVRCAVPGSPAGADVPAGGVPVPDRSGMVAVGLALMDGDDGQERMISAIALVLSAQAPKPLVRNRNLCRTSCGRSPELIDRYSSRVVQMEWSNHV
jgi:hypothetical protein